MAFDQHKNLAIASVANSPGAAGTTLTVAGGEGARFPAVPFNATVWPATELPTPVTAEVVRVTAIAADSFTIARSQEGTPARAIVAGDLIAATITAKTITDIESGVNFPLITTPGSITTYASIQASDNIIAGYQFYFGGKSAIQSPADGIVKLSNNSANDFDRLQFGGTTSAYPALKRSGAGLAVRTADDSGPADLSVGTLVLPTAGTIRTNTVDGADTGYILINSASAPGDNRGAYFAMYGNEVPGAGGAITFLTGNTPEGAINFHTGPGILRGKIHPSGGFSWGGTYDPGAGGFYVGPTTFVGGQPFIWLMPGGTVRIGAPVTTTHPVSDFVNANGFVGSITTAGSATAYNTTSDARLKTPLGRHTDPEVLRRTVIHDFKWKSDGTPGRGVFAQEAVGVLPCAVSVGSDEVDDQGRLTQPWGVDYSKYVPDLITGWQDHDATVQHHDMELQALKTRVAWLEAAAVKADPNYWPSTVTLSQSLEVIYAGVKWIRRRLFPWVPSWV